MEKTLVREVPFGKAVARISVTIYTVNRMFDDTYEVQDVKMKKKIEIVAGGKIATTDTVAVVAQDGDYFREEMIKRGLDLNKKYTKVGRAWTEGEETANEIKKAIAEMEEELKTEFGQKTEKEEEIEEAQAVIAQAEKEGVENLMTAEELKVWRKNYNLVNNEGGEGYIPIRISKERYQNALDVLNK
jgi:hypothetical protein